MRLNEYQVLAKSTAAYPAHMKLSYPALGLAGEIFEFMEKVEQLRRDRDEILSELGDILWYIAGVATDAELTLFGCAGVERFEDINPAHPSTYGLARFARPVLENVKKCFRDDLGAMTDTRREEIENGLGWLLQVLDGYALVFESTLKEVAELNIAKLKSRKERGVIQGDGDNR